MMRSIVVLGIVVSLLMLGIWFAITQPVFRGENFSRAVIVKPERLQGHVRNISQSFFPRDYRHPANLNRAAEYIRKEFEDAGGKISEQVYAAAFDPARDRASFVQKPASPDETYRNVIASFGPDTKERIIVGAHYDAYGELPAADDNASGVAGLIELAHLLGNCSLPMRVELVAYTLEEPMTIDGDGLFRSVGGSAVHAYSMKAEGVRVRMMLSLEMIGYFDDAHGSQHYPSSLFRLAYPSQGNFIMVVGRLRDGWLARRLKKTMRSATPLPIYSVNAPTLLEGIDWSDHSNYWKQGFPAVMITDILPTKSNLYHTAKDAPARLDYKRMALVVEGVYAAVLKAAEDGSKESKMNQDVNYFSPDYLTARTRFRQSVEKAGGRLRTIPLDAKGPNKEDLTIDIGWFGSDQPKKVLLHSSGIHGVEAFAGSAIQLQLLENLPKLPSDTAVVFVHALNPYGMAWLRRYNEHNVDLNRNFLEYEQFLGAPVNGYRSPVEYPELTSFLCPVSPPSGDYFYSLAAFYLEAGRLIWKHGYSQVKQAVAGGQYEYPKCLFFGGKHLEQGPEKYQTFVAEHLSSAEQVVGIDVHTGLGKFGEDTLLVEDADYPRLREIFGPRVESLGSSSGTAYETPGAIGPMISRVLHKARVDFVTQEFGTYSGIKVLYALREENRWHQYGGGTLDHPTKQNLKKAFYPNDDTWRLRVLQRGRELFNQASGLLVGGTPDRTRIEHLSQP